MVLAVPLGIRLATSRADRRVTDIARGVRCRTVAPGGFASCTVDLDRPLSMQPDELAAFGRLYVYDTTHGGTVWEGRVEDLGRQADASGQVWSISAVGPSAHAHDDTRALFYADGRLDALKPSGSSFKAGETGEDETPAATPETGMRLRFPRGVAVATGDRVSVYYNEMRDAGVKLAVVHAGTWAGLTAGSWAARWRTFPAAGGNNLVTDVTLTAGDMGTATRTIGTNWSAAGADDAFAFDLTFINAVATTVSVDTVWTITYDFVAQQVRMDRAGNELLTAASYSSNTVQAHQVVEDLLGRMLPRFDGPGASIDTSAAYGFDQLAWPDGADAWQILDDVMAVIGTHLWEALETNPDNGRWRFNWRPWPTTVRYDTTTLDGYSSPVSAGEVYDKVTVRWRAANGRVRTTTRTQSVPALTAAGFSRTGFLDLGDNTGTLADAQKAGDAWLADRQIASNGGTLTVTRPILDRVSGRVVQPWEIRPGYLIRIRGVEPSIDLLNEARNGTSVCRVVAVDYDDASNSAVLELDAYTRSQAHQLARLATRLQTRRRR